MRQALRWWRTVAIQWQQGDCKLWWVGMEGKREEVTKDGANASHHHFTLIRTTAGEDALTMTVSQAGKLQRASVTSDAPKDIELVQLA